MSITIETCKEIGSRVIGLFTTRKALISGSGSDKSISICQKQSH